MQRRPKEEERGKKESWSGFRFTFEQRSFCFHRFGTARRERENFHIVHRSPQNSKQLFQESLWISSPLLQSVSTTEKTSSLSSLLFLSLRHTDISLRWTLAYFPFFSSFSLFFSLANFFFLHIVIAQACRLWRPLSRISGASFETSLFLETFSFVKLEFAFPPARRRRSPEALSLSNATSPRLRRDNGSKDHTQPLLDLKFRCCCSPKEHRPTGHVEKSRRDAIVTKPLPWKDQTTNRDTSRSFPSVSHRDLSEPVYFRRIKYHCTNRWGKRWVFLNILVWSLEFIEDL